MNDPKKSLSVLEKLIYEMPKVDTLAERAALYAAARWLIQDFEEQCARKNAPSGISEPNLLRIRESFGGFLGTEPVNPDSNLTCGAMGLNGLKEITGLLED